MTHSDPVALLQKLIQCPSVTPQEGGALALLEGILTELGFEVERIIFSEDGDEPDVENLYARYGKKGKHLMFAGHTDVVPTGDISGWTHDPFSGQVENGEIYGRGAVDMKGGIASFIAACADFLASNNNFDGSISLLITGDEEGPAINGTDKLLKYASDKGETWDACIVGEPTNPNELGDMIKIGRRGSLSGRVTIIGKQGHVAYPHLASNPAHGAALLVNALIEKPFDEGTDQFPPTNLEVTSIDVGNSAYNVIPGQARFQFNIRFNDLWDEHSLTSEIKQRFKEIGESPKSNHGQTPINYDIEIVNRVSPVFLTKDDALIGKMQDAVQSVTGRLCDLSTTGGTSDARFIKDYCPVVEFGLVGQTMHMTNERARVEDVNGLKDIYRKFLDMWFT